MRHLTILMASAAFIAVPMVGHANDYTHDKTKMHKTKNMHDDDNAQTRTQTYNTYNDAETFYVKVKSEDNYVFTDGQHQYTFDLTSNEKLLIKGDSAFLIQPDGNRYYAPESAYYTQAGYVVNVEDGSVYSIEEPAEVAYVEIDTTAPNAGVRTYKVK